MPIDHTVRYPLVAGGRVFVSVQIGSEAPVVHALDAATGTRVDPDAAGCLRGAAYGDGQVIVSTDSTLYALDAATGAAVDLDLPRDADRDRRRGRRGHRLPGGDGVDRAAGDDGGDVWRGRDSGSERAWR